MTAFILVADNIPMVATVQRHTFVRYVDSVFNSNDRPLMRGDTQNFTFGGPGPDGTQAWRVDLEVKAAIFADGSTFGDPEWVKRLVDSRRFLYRHLQAALEALQSARGTAVTDSNLVQQFQDRKMAAMTASAGDREEGRAIRVVYGTIGVNLERTTMLDGTPAPLDVRIDAITQLLLQKRQLLLSSKPSVGQP
jgi:hypothetical protein